MAWYPIKELIRVITRKLKQYEARRIVVDPVMVATSGARLISEDAIETLKQELFPLATVLTPNIPEAEVLSGQSIKTADDMISAAKVISDSYHCAVLCKGGHDLNDANDLLYYEGMARWFRGKRINNPNTHGTGCTLSSAIASNLAKGYDLPAAVEQAKNTFPVHSPRCWISDPEAVRWIMALPFTTLFTNEKEV